MSSARLGSATEERIARLAQMEGVSKSEIQRRAITKYLDEKLVEPKKNPFDFLDQYMFAGPPDMSENLGEKFADAMVEKYGSDSH